MARLSDLPPEIRLKIYQLLLIDPIREGLRITLTLDPLHGSRTTWDRASCVQTTEPPHNAEHSAHPCYVEAVSSTLHHFDFTDLVSLTRANKLLYAEASQTIFNNADLTVSLSHLSPAGRTISASTLLNCYLEQHCSTTRSMLRSLIIQDKLGAMSPRDMKAVVDLVNIRLPGLNVLEYHIGDSTTRSIPDLLHNSCRSFSRLIRVVQPLVVLRDGIRKTAGFAVPTQLESTHPELHHSLRQIKDYFAREVTPDIAKVRDYRRGIRKVHAVALHHGYYLRVTSALRSSPDGEVRPDNAIDALCKALDGMQGSGRLVSWHRETLQEAREIDQHLH